MSQGLWQRCIERLSGELPEADLNMWILPLQAEEEELSVTLFAPNDFVQDSISENHLGRIQEILNHLSGEVVQLKLTVGSKKEPAKKPRADRLRSPETPAPEVDSNLDLRYTFADFVQGKSNELAHAAAMQVATNPGSAYNPLLLYGGTGLGKTHLLHACGHQIVATKRNARVVYLQSERFVTNMINALRHNMIDQFKREYRTVDALLIDDIQFLAGKERSQEEFFHTFNSLLDGRQQIVLSCDRYPKEVTGLEARLKSRFGWGLTVAVEPPDYETRVAILMSKAASARMAFSEDVAYFIAGRMRTHVRDLEGALNTLCANSRFTGRAITVDFAKETLRDLLAVHDRLVTIERIQRQVAEFYKIRVAEILSRRRTRSIARPRQMAMSLAKELTDHSLPEIGDAFGGRDHTTVIHACRRIEELSDTDARCRDDRAKLLRLLTT